MELNGWAIAVLLWSRWCFFTKKNNQNKAPIRNQERIWQKSSPFRIDFVSPKNKIDPKSQIAGHQVTRLRLSCHRSLGHRSTPSCEAGHLWGLRTWTRGIKPWKAIARQGRLPSQWNRGPLRCSLQLKNQQKMVLNWSFSPVLTLLVKHMCHYKKKTQDVISQRAPVLRGRCLSNGSSKGQHGQTSIFQLLQLHLLGFWSNQLSDQVDLNLPSKSVSFKS